jgi:hypothetical protein
MDANQKRLKKNKIWTEIAFFAISCDVIVDCIAKKYA